MLDKLTVDDLRPSVGQAFRLEAPDGGDSFQLELTGARTIEPDAPAVEADGHRSPFALDFRGPSEPILPQSIYRLEHDEVGPLEIFIVPVGRTAAGVDYEAIFT